MEVRVTSRSIAEHGSARPFIGLSLPVGLMVARRAAAAEGRVVVLDVTGPKGDAFTKAIVELVKKNNEYISQRRFDRAAKKAKAKGLGAAAVAKTADRLNADAVVIGKVRKRPRGKFELSLVVRGKDGA